MRAGRDTSQSYQMRHHPAAELFSGAQHRLGRLLQVRLDLLEAGDVDEDGEVVLLPVQLEVTAPGQQVQRPLRSGPLHRHLRLPLSDGRLGELFELRELYLHVPRVDLPTEELTPPAA